MITIKIKNNLLYKILQLRKQIKLYEKKILEYVNIEQKYNDELNKKQMIIREQSLKIKQLEKIIKEITNE